MAYAGIMASDGGSEILGGKGAIEQRRGTAAMQRYPSTTAEHVVIHAFISWSAISSISKTRFKVHLLP
jgi:hypothetical protein